MTDCIVEKFSLNEFGLESCKLSNDCRFDDDWAHCRCRINVIEAIFSIRISHCSRFDYYDHYDYLLLLNENDDTATTLCI